MTNGIPIPQELFDRLVAYLGEINSLIVTARAQGLGVSINHDVPHLWAWLANCGSITPRAIYGNVAIDGERLLNNLALGDD